APGRAGFHRRPARYPWTRTHAGAITARSRTSRERQHSLSPGILVTSAAANAMQASVILSHKDSKLRPLKALTQHYYYQQSHWQAGPVSTGEAHRLLRVCGWHQQGGSAGPMR
ncbi:MAG: hypothetical protein OXD01_12780, partial [Gammaproteobacteria bacterium]|nr:hypothetical protein [Gammaproteobacteria bacterium]